MQKKKSYIRDKRSPKPKNESTSKVMSANKAKNTKPEILLRKSIREHGLTGYRLHPKDVPGRPDICFISKKVAVFMNGCFWHRCPKCNYPDPKNNQKFWIEKFSKNVARDKVKKEQLQKLGWNVIVVWECDIKKNLDPIVKSVIKALRVGS